MDRAGKVALLTGGRDIAVARGIEIGPRDAPLISKSDGPVLYADYADTETVRRNLHGTDLDPAAVMDVDIVTGGGKLSDAVLGRFAYVVASHVAEHVPDLLGWLTDIHAVLEYGGTLGLAIPDKRFTFDRFRAESTIAEAVEAYLAGYERPSLRQIFDSAWPSTEFGVMDGWRNVTPPCAELPKRLARLPSALRLVQRVQNQGVYNDAHCWVFTPASFLDLLEQASMMALLPYTLEQFHPTEQDGYEFYAVLRCAEGDHAEATAHSVSEARRVLNTWPPERNYAEAHAPAELRALRAENAMLRETLAVMRDATIWRATAPLRRVVERVRRR